MRFQVIAAVALAHGAFAALDRRQDTIPACLTSCISDANTDTCDPADTACLCNNQTFVNSITSCVQSTCDADSVQAAAQSASALCQAAVSGPFYINYGATLAIPTSTEAGASSASSAFSSLASSASSAASAASSVASSAASGASSAASASATSDNNSASPKSVSLLAGFAALFAALVL
ncbi:hypothetical protein EV122DRAFT_263867 [Schizophyllum commune]